MICWLYVSECVYIFVFEFCNPCLWPCFFSCVFKDVEFLWFLIWQMMIVKRILFYTLKNFSDVTTFITSDKLMPLLWGLFVLRWLICLYVPFAAFFTQNFTSADSKVATQNRLCAWNEAIYTYRIIVNYIRQQSENASYVMSNVDNTNKVLKSTKKIELQTIRYGN